MGSMLKSALKNILTDEEIKRVYSSFDIVGDIIIIKIPDTLENKKNIIANALLERIKTVNTIFQQSSPVSGEYRTRDLEFLAGENKTLTEYREHGCVFKVDVATTYFSPRLSTERLRISNMIGENEVIVNMFGGIGTYSIILAKKNADCIVYSIDSNPMANHLCIVNTKLNKVENRVKPILGDARIVIEDQLKNVATRVLMPLPERASEFVDCAMDVLKNKKGFIHFFSHVKSNNKLQALDDAINNCDNIFNSFDHQIISSRVVREVGPRIYQVVCDIQL